ncbi:uncharacterized protein IWZ02DRAFT_435674 [Phyllosticta citriasiana]|uniref:uncharacterized protein n=1 Tax=Phyllosticta citriasiana TaxID=595635 RepID=UPI0030FD696A
MDVPRPLFSESSQNDAVNSVDSSTTPSLAESAASSLLQSRMSLMSPRAEERITAIACIANRLLFADGFQREILEAIRLVHMDLRATLAQGVTPQTVKAIEHQSTIVGSILTQWTRKHQAFSEELESLNFKNTANTPQEALTFKAKVLRIPEINGCELNFAAAQRLQKFFVEWVISPFLATGPTTHDLPHFVAAAKQIQTCFDKVRDRFEDAAFSAEQLSRDTVKAWQNVARMRAEVEEGNSLQQGRNQDKSNRSKHGFKSFFSKLKGHSKKDSEYITNGSGEDLQKVLPASHLDLGLEEAGKRPHLAVFPPAPLSVLESQQKDLQRHHEHLRRLSQLSRPETIRVSNSSQIRSSKLDEHRRDIPPILESPRRPTASQPEHAAKFIPYSTSKENCRHDHEVEKNSHGSVPHRKQIVDERIDPTFTELPELTQLETEILEASVPDHASQPESEEDPEAAKSWWRERALQDLEAGVTGDADFQAHEKASEDLTEVERTRRKGKAMAKALAMLEGESGGHAEENGGGPITYDFSRLSFRPDQTERFGRKL